MITIAHQCKLLNCILSLSALNIKPHQLNQPVFITERLHIHTHFTSVPCLRIYIFHKITFCLDYFKIFTTSKYFAFTYANFE